MCGGTSGCRFQVCYRENTTPCENEVPKMNFNLLVPVFESNIFVNFICLFHIICVYFMIRENEHIFCISGENSLALSSEICLIS